MDLRESVNMREGVYMIVCSCMRGCVRMSEGK